MFKVTMIDDLGWMKDNEIVTGSMVALIKFIVVYVGLTGRDIVLDHITKLDDDEKYVYKTADGLRLTVVKK